jgi:hypothetical protein
MFKATAPENDDILNFFFSLRKWREEEEKRTSIDSHDELTTYINKARYMPTAKAIFVLAVRAF